MKKFLSDTSGNVATTTALMALPLLFGVGVAVDYTRISNEKSSLQELADNAALAGASADADQEISTAQQFFDTGGMQGVIPEITYGNNRVSVSVDYSLPLVVLGSLSNQFSNISIKSVAVKGESRNACIYVLDDMQRDALKITSSGTFVSGCGVQVNSDDAQAVSMINSGDITIPDVSIVGSYSNVSSGTVNVGFASNQSPAPDPLANLPTPPEDGRPCDYNNETVISSGSVTVSPGVYCGGLSLIGSGSVTMQPGTYVFRGGPFSINVSGSLSGDDVLFYFEDDQSYFLTNSSGSTTFTSNSTGPYKGILVFQGRASTSPANSYVLNMSGSNQYGGAIYVPNANIQWNLSGTNTVPHQTPVIADTLDINMSGTVELALDPDSSIPLADELSPLSTIVRLAE